MSLGPSVTLQCIAIVHKLFSSAMNNSSLELFVKFLIIGSETSVTGGMNYSYFKKKTLFHKYIGMKFRNTRTDNKAIDLVSANINLYL